MKADTLKQKNELRSLLLDFVDEWAKADVGEKSKEAFEKHLDIIFSSLKVAEATLPNVKDWDEVYDKFKENYKNSEHILHPINFLSWLKQNYSTPLSASEHRTIKEVLDLFSDEEKVKLLMIEFYNSFKSPKILKDDIEIVNNYYHKFRTLFSQPIKP